MYVIALCLKYLRLRRGIILSILALATGVTALIVVIAVMNGFGGLMRDRVRGSLSDVVVRCEDVWGVGDARNLGRELAQLPHVSGCSAHLSSIAFLSLTDGESAVRVPVEFVGLAPLEEARVGRFSDWLLPPGAEPFVLAGDFRPRFPVILGAQLASALPGGGLLGTQVLLATPTSWDEYNIAPFTVTNHFHSGHYRQDSDTVFLPLAVAQQWRRAPDRATSFHLGLDDFSHAPEVVAAAKAVVAGRKEEFFVATWQQMNRELLAALVAERTIWVIVLTLLLALAGFSVVAVLNLIVFQRRRDIGVVRSVGAGRLGVSATFLLYGLVVGLAGSALGVLAGGLVLANIDRLEKLLPGGVFPRDIFYLQEHIPWDIPPATVSLFALLGVVMSVLASLWPARRAARLRPADVLHRMV